MLIIRAYGLGIHLQTNYKFSVSQLWHVWCNHIYEAVESYFIKYFYSTSCAQNASKHEKPRKKYKIIPKWYVV